MAVLFKGVQTVLDHEKQWARDRIKALIHEALAEQPSAGEPRPVQTSLTKPKQFRYLEEQPRRGK